MISKQVKELRKYAAGYRKTALGLDGTVKVLEEAADTIEALSAKLAAADKELKRWHTDHINEKIKNPFAWTSTLICQNCDHKDEYIEELEAAYMERSAEDCGGGWISAKIKNDNFICDKKLKNYYGVILITYETMKKRRYTKPVLCNYGYISKKIGGEITAWRFMPEPYHEP